MSSSTGAFHDDLDPLSGGRDFISNESNYTYSLQMDSINSDMSSGLISDASGFGIEFSGWDRTTGPDRIASVADAPYGAMETFYGPAQSMKISPFDSTTFAHDPTAATSSSSPRQSVANTIFAPPLPAHRSLLAVNNNITNNDVLNDPMLAMYSHEISTSSSGSMTADQIVDELVVTKPPRSKRAKLTRDASPQSALQTQTQPAPAGRLSTRRASAAAAVAVAFATPAPVVAAPPVISHASGGGGYDEDGDGDDSSAPITATATQVRNRGVVSALLHRMNQANRQAAAAAAAAAANGGANHAGGSSGGGASGFGSRKHKRKRGEVQKAKHNVAEKRRRSEMNDAIDRIKVLLPNKEEEEEEHNSPGASSSANNNSSSSIKPTKVSVLMDAAEYIENVQALVCQLAEENQDLQEETARLKSELAALRVGEQWVSLSESSVHDDEASPVAEEEAAVEPPVAIEAVGEAGSAALPASATRTYVLSPSEAAALGIKDYSAQKSVAEMGSSYGQNFATMALLTVLFFTFWGQFLSVFDLNDAEYGISRVLLSIPSQPTFTVHLVNILTEVCRFLWGAFCWFRFFFLVYLFSAWRTKFITPQSSPVQYEKLKARLQELQAMRVKMGTARSFHAAMKLNKSLHRSVPKHPGSIALYFGFFIQLVRFVSITLYFGYWIERLVLYIRRLRPQVAQAASLQLNAQHLLVDSFPETNLQFWYAALRLYNDATVYITPDAGGAFSQDLLRVRVYKGIALRLRHHLAAPCRWFGNFCDAKGTVILKSFMEKVNAVGAKRTAAIFSESGNDSSDSDDTDSAASDDDDTEAEADADDFHAEMPSTPAATTRKQVSASDQLMGIALATINQLMHDIDDARFSKAEQNGKHLLQFFVDSGAISAASDTVQPTMAWGKSRINLMIAFTQFCQGRTNEAIKSLSDNIKLLSDADSEDSEVLTTSQILLSIIFLERKEVAAASRLLDHVRRTACLEVSTNAQMRLLFESAQAKLHLVQGDHHSCMRSLRSVVILCNATCQDHRFQDLAIASFVTTIMLELLELSKKADNKQYVAELTEMIRIALSLLARASATTKFFVPAYHYCMARFASLQQNSNNNNNEVTKLNLLRALKAAQEMHWDHAANFASAEMRRLNIAPTASHSQTHCVPTISV